MISTPVNSSSIVDAIWDSGLPFSLKICQRFLLEFDCFCFGVHQGMPAKPATLN